VRIPAFGGSILRVLYERYGTILVGAVCLVFAGCEVLPRSSGPASARTTPAPSPSAERRGIALLTDFKANRPDIKEYQSLVVTDREILEHFSFAEVMATLSRQSGDSGSGPLELFRQWWNTQNGPGPAPMCQNQLFGFPYLCPRAEGEQSGDDPFGGIPADAGYIAIGIVNRIDLADPDGTDCGEYRIVFARKSGVIAEDQRLLVNFEAVLPNPSRWRGLAGCKPIAEFWRGLSDVDDPVERARLLRRFYLYGVELCPGCGRTTPVVHVDNYGLRRCGFWTPRCTTGQIRTNQFMRGAKAPMPGSWLLREFRLRRECRKCPLQFVPSRVAQSPYGGLFDAAGTHPLKPAFQDALLKALRNRELIDGDVDTISYHVPAQFTSGQSQSCNPSPGQPSCLDQMFEGNYIRNLDPVLKQKIVGVLIDLGVEKKISAEQVVRRAQALSCAGCHRLSNQSDLGNGVFWPRSIDFVHITEREVINGRYRISEMLTNSLEFRKSKLAAVMELK
jgi:hypothetical protein